MVFPAADTNCSTFVPLRLIFRELLKRLRSFLAGKAIGYHECRARICPTLCDALTPFLC